jgi:hypothetical protein
MALPPSLSNRESGYKRHGENTLKSAQALLWLLSIPAVAIAQNPLPLVNPPLVPASVAPGASGFTLTVNGTGFISGAIVEWNGLDFHMRQ